MRAAAEQAACHPAVIYLDGRAGQIPLAARSRGGLLSTR